MVSWGPRDSQLLCPSTACVHKDRPRLVGFKRLVCLFEKVVSCLFENWLNDINKEEGKEKMVFLPWVRARTSFSTGLVWWNVSCASIQGNAGARGPLQPTCGPGATETRPQSAQSPVRPDGLGVVPSVSTEGILCSDSQAGPCARGPSGVLDPDCSLEWSQGGLKGSPTVHRLLHQTEQHCCL